MFASILMGCWEVCVVDWVCLLFNVILYLFLVLYGSDGELPLTDTEIQTDCRCPCQCDIEETLAKE